MLNWTRWKTLTQRMLFVFCKVELHKEINGTEWALRIGNQSSRCEALVEGLGLWCHKIAEMGCYREHHKLALFLCSWKCCSWALYCRILFKIVFGNFNLLSLTYFLINHQLNALQKGSEGYNRFWFVQGVFKVSRPVVTRFAWTKAQATFGH